jgi:hypothetical protein
MRGTVAEQSVVVMKHLYWVWSEGIVLSGFYSSKKTEGNLRRYKDERKIGQYKQEPKGYLRVQLSDL